MRRLTNFERSVLQEVGSPGEYVPDEVFGECIRQGWGYWGEDGYWHTTEAGARALAFDVLADTVDTEEEKP